MPRTFKQNKEIKDQRKSDILSESVALFAKYGYNNVTMENIAKATKCSRTLLYHYFSSKDDLLLAHKKICEEIFVKKINELIKAYEPGKAFLKACNEFFINVIYKGTTDSCYYLYLFTNGHFHINEIGNKSNNKDKTLLNYIKTSFNVYCESKPNINKSELKDQIKYYLLFIGSLATSHIQYPKTFKERIDPDSLFYSFFSLRKGD